MVHLERILAKTTTMWMRAPTRCDFHNAFQAPSFVISRKSVIDVCTFYAIYPENVTPNPRMVNYRHRKITKSISTMTL